MPFNVQFLSQAIVGLPTPYKTQATTNASVVLTGGLAEGFYLFQSDKVCHIKPGADGTTPTADADSPRIPANQLVAISTDVDIEIAIIRGADEVANGKLWISKMLETSKRLT